MEFREIDDAGHSPMFEQPDAYNAALAAFLVSVVSDAPRPKAAVNERFFS